MAYGPPRATYPLAADARTEVPWLVTRLFVAIVDACTMLLGLLVLSVLLGGFFGNLGFGFAAFVAYGSWFLYKPVAEAWTGRTVGKWMLGLKVVDARTRGQIGFGAALLRSLVLCFATAPICALVAVLSEKRRGLHDLVAGTLVIRSEPSV